MPTSMDVAWFRNWTDGIIRDTGVDPSNQTNAIALLVMAGKSIHGFGHQLMDNFGGAWAKPILDEYMRSDEATPWGAVSLIAGWERDSIPAQEQNLRSLAEMLVEVGPSEDGVFFILE